MTFGEGEREGFKYIASTQCRECACPPTGKNLFHSGIRKLKDVTTCSELCYTRVNLRLYTNLTLKVDNWNKTLVKLTVAFEWCNGNCLVSLTAFSTSVVYHLCVVVIHS